MSDENPVPSPPPIEGGYLPPPPPAHREPNWKRLAKNRERIAALVVLPLLLVVIVAAVVASAATSDEPSTADSPPTTTESPTTTTEATTTPPGTLTGPVPAPPGVDQASADAFAAAIADTLATSVVPGLDQNSLQASLDLMAIHCQLLDSIAATDPMGVDDAVRRVVASLDAGSLSAVVRAQVKAWYAAMFDAAADHLCPQHAVVLDDAAADLRRGATLSG